MNDTPTVRLATSADEAGLIELCRLMHGENGLFQMSEAKVRARVQNSFRREGGAIGVIGPHDDICAAVMLELAQLWYTDDWHVADLMVFVHPEHRRSNCIKALIDFARTTAVGIGLPMLSGVVSNTRTEAKVRLYQRALGAPVGAFFVYNSTVAPSEPVNLFPEKRRRRRRALIGSLTQEQTPHG